MTPNELIAYYADLLILQYRSKPKAYANILTYASQVIMPQTTVQQLAFSSDPTSGTFLLQYDELHSINISWNESAASIQTALRLIPGLGSVTVTGAVSTAGLTITFVGVTPIVPLMTVSDNTLVDVDTIGVIVTVTETDQTLPLVVQDAFNVFGSNVAQGVQLDVIGKYAGVNRSISNLTLSDADFLTVIQFAIAKNNSGSSLATIESSLYDVFPGDFIVVDYQDMAMSYIFNSALVNLNVLTVLINEGLLPRPMGVGATVIITPVVDNFFGYRTYDAENILVKPFNTYDDFNTDWNFLSYDNVFVA